MINEDNNGENAENKSSKYKFAKKRQSEHEINFITTQLTICLIVVLAALIIKLIGGDFYTNIRTSYAEKINYTISTDDVLDVTESTSSGTTTSGEEVITSSEPTTSDSNITEYEEYVKMLNDLIESQGVTTEQTGTSSESEVLAENIATSKPAAPTTSSNTEETANNELSSIIMPLNGEITSEYGYRINPVSNDYTKHKGIDIAANSGDEVHAALDGKVIEVASSSDYGNYVILDHGYGVKTVYAHNSKVLPKVGDTVKQGDVIAIVGSTGKSTGPHCHFEVRIDDVCIDPLWVLPLPIE